MPIDKEKLRDFFRRSSDPQGSGVKGPGVAVAAGAALGLIGKALKGDNTLRKRERAAKKLQRAEAIKTTRPKRAAKLTERAAKLTNKANNNNAKSPLGKLQAAAQAQMPKNLSDFNKGKENIKIQGGLKKTYGN